MGQRSQHYLIRHRYYRRDDKRVVGGGETFLTGIHNQDLRGRGFVRTVHAYLSFLGKQWQPDKQWGPTINCFLGGGPEDTKVVTERSMRFLYGVDPQTGTYYSTHTIEPDRPERYEAEHGFSVIDFRDPHRPRYCIAYLNEQREQPKFKVLDTAGYLAVQYPNEPGAYWRTLQEHHNTPELRRKFHAYVAGVHRENKYLARLMQPFEVLTLADLFEIFPASAPNRRTKKPVAA